MDRLIYTAMTGAAQALEQQSTIANNLANTSTTGFRSQLYAFRQAPLQQGDQIGSSNDDVTRTYVVSATPTADYAPGTIEQTGNPLDLAVQGDGWLTVQTADGNEAYSRAGNLHVNADGQLVNASNLSVMGNGGPIAIPPGAEVTIAKDGTVSVRGAGETANSLAVVDQLKLVNPAQQDLVRGDDGLFRKSDGTPAETDPTVQVSQGALEGSNVNPVSAMVSMIANARQYENHMKMLSMADNNEQSANQILSFS